MPKHLTWSQKLLLVLASRRFFWCIVVLLVLQALWIALSGLYPMAFDENFHLGIIKIYAQHLTPFLSVQPDNASSYGAVARDPSYLYHYVFSFPYRLISWLTDNVTVQIIVLRLLNIGCFALGLPLYRRLLLKTGASRALVHTALLVFVLIPVVPLLAAQINYDNVILPLTALALLLTVSISQELSAYKRIRTERFLQLAIVCLLASLVKYAFLPIFLAIGIFLIVQCVLTYRTWGKFWLSLGFGFTLIKRSSRYWLLAGLILSIGLFIQRDGLNTVRYHTPVPDCEQVLTTQECQDYGPWARNYQLAEEKPSTASHSPAAYSADWLYGMWLRSFFAVDGPTTDFETRGPLFVPPLAGLVFPALAFVAFVVYGRRVFKRYNRGVLVLFLTVSAVYIAVLWADGFQTYGQTGQPVAINGRYLFPVLPMLLVIGGLSLREVLHKSQLQRVVLALVIVLSLAWGGGVMTYILRSHNDWYWPSPIVRNINGAARSVLKPLVPGSKRPTEFLNWN